MSIQVHPLPQTPLIRPNRRCLAFFVRAWENPDGLTHPGICLSDYTTIIHPVSILPRDPTQPPRQLAGIALANPPTSTLQVVTGGLLAPALHEIIPIRLRGLSVLGICNK